MNKKDIYAGLLAGLLIGLLAMPVVRTVKFALIANLGIFIIPIFLIGAPVGLWVFRFIADKLSIATIWQVGKFGLVGVLNTLVDWGVLAALPLVFGINFETMLIAGLGITFYTLYKAISFLVSLVNSYYWNKLWVFEDKGERAGSKFIQFSLVSVIGFAVNIFTASTIFNLSSGMAFTEGQRGILGAAAATIFSLVWNFLGYKFIVFKEE